MDILIAAGGHAEKIDFPTQGYVLGSMQAVDQGLEHIWLVGWIEDIDEMKTCRRTDFCLHWDPRAQRFFAVDDPDDELAD